jgi:hypothetical protein
MSPAERVPVQNAYRPSAFFDFLAADDFADQFHDTLAARAFERVAAPCLQDEVTPEGAQLAGGLFRRCRDEEDGGLDI